MGDSDTQTGGSRTSLGNELVGTNYPYVNVKNNLLNPFLTTLRRGYASLNPFAIQQMPTEERMGFGLRWGNAFYVPESYPNGIVFSRMFPTHYDPLKDMKRPAATWQVHKYAPGQFSTIKFTSDSFPRGCVRQIQKLQRCAMVNGEENCHEEVNDLVNICPTWTLDAMKEKGFWLAKVRAIQNQQYRRAMEVSTYNKGRTMADVSDRTWIDGTRDHLRPDTMWADERYLNVTQAEVNEAAKRMKERREKAAGAVKSAHHDKKHGDKHHDAHHGDHGHGHGHGHDDHGDYEEAQFRKSKPLYP